MARTMARIGHNRPPPDDLSITQAIEPFNLDHRPYLAQMDVDGIVAVIRQLEAELVPLRDVHLQVANAYRGGSIVNDAFGFDNERFRQLQSLLADCRIEIRERRNPGHPEARPSAHELQHAREMDILRARGLPGGDGFGASPNPTHYFRGL